MTAGGVWHGRVAAGRLVAGGATRPRPVRTVQVPGVLDETRTRSEQMRQMRGFRLSTGRDFRRMRGVAAGGGEERECPRCGGRVLTRVERHQDGRVSRYGYCATCTTTIDYGAWYDECEVT